MNGSINKKSAGARLKAFLSGLSISLVLVGLTTGIASATEKGASSYPVGVETVMPGLTPPPGITMFEEFDTTYQANKLVGPNGQSLVPGFDLSVYVVAPKLVHNWGIHVLGGSLVSAAAIPLLNENVTVPGAIGHKTGLGNAELGVAYVAYNSGSWHWWYGLDVLTPGLVYHKNDLVNIGQHYFSTVPVAAFTYMPHHGATEISSRLQYLVNYTNPDTYYRSGNEFTWEYAAMQNVTEKIAIGANGYYYQQVTDDLQNGVRFGDGNRGRDFAIGPQVRCHVGHIALIAKYQRDTLVQNKAMGNAFWLELGVPLGHPRSTRASTAPVEGN